MGELEEKLTEYGKSDFYPFHMPGHKRNLNADINPYKIDITEIDGFDNLHDPKDVLKRLTERIAKIYGADKAYISINGSTAGILMAISGTTEYGDEILIARNSHKAVYNAIHLRGLKSRYLYPDISTCTGINCSINPNSVEKVLKENPKIKVVLITSPTYEGVVSDIENISDICHKYDAILIVDAAHGAHLGFNDYWPENPVRLGADIVIMSLHKTLPALTQTAVVCINSGFVNVSKLKIYYDIYNSSSPSYVFMCSVEKCMDYLENSGELFDKYRRNLNVFYANCKPSILKIIRTDDPGKIVISTENANISGEELSEIFRKEFHLEMEMASCEYVIAMTSVCDTEEGFDRLLKAIMQIDKKIFRTEKKLYFPLKETEIVSTIYDGMRKNLEYTELCKSEGKISGDYVYAYPPGIPIVAPGEKISKEIIDIITRSIEMNVNICGLKDGKVSVWQNYMS